MQLFRLVDVLPVLDSNKEVARHVAEYLGDSSDALPPAMQRVLGLARQVPFLTAPPTRRVVRRIARSFILARDPTEAVSRLRAMRDRSTAFTVDLLGETVLSEREAEEFAARYLDLVERSRQCCRGVADQSNVRSRRPRSYPGGQHLGKGLRAIFADQA